MIQGIHPSAHWVLMIGILTAHLACKTPKSGRSAFKGENLHSARIEWNPAALRRETSMPLKECDRSSFASTAPVATRYLQRLVRHIASHPLNRLSFSGDLAAENICVGLSLGGVRAFANAAARTIVVEDGAILRAQNDAQVASLLAHELAHLTMRHSYLDGTIVPPPDREAWQSAFRERLTVTEALDLLKETESQPYSAAARARYVQLEQRDETLRERMYDLVSRHFGPEAASNWEEAEADAVGLNYYLASGFTAEEIAWRVQQIVIAEANGEDVHGPPPDISGAVRRLRAYAACNVPVPSAMSQPERGRRRYPLPCWTIWDLLHDQFRRYPEYSSRLSRNDAIVNFSDGPNLVAAKSELNSLNPVGN